METETIEETVRRTLETLASSAARTTARRPAVKLSDKQQRQKKSEWLKKWLRLTTTHHPQLRTLEDMVYAFCSDYAKRPARGYRMVIHGDNGTGKSHVARAVHAWANAVSTALPRVGAEDTSDGLWTQRTADASYWKFPHLVREVPRYRDRDIIAELTQRPGSPCLLILDDVGAEHDPSKFGASIFYQLLENREHQWTLITTNHVPDSWAERWDRRVASRLLRNTKLVALDQVPDFSSL